MVSYGLKRVQSGDLKRKQQPTQDEGERTKKNITAKTMAREHFNFEYLPQEIAVISKNYFSTTHFTLHLNILIIVVEGKELIMLIVGKWKDYHGDFGPRRTVSVSILTML